MSTATSSTTFVGQMRELLLVAVVVPFLCSGWGPTLPTASPTSTPTGQPIATASSGASGGQLSANLAGVALLAATALLVGHLHSITAIAVLAGWAAVWILAATTSGGRPCSGS